jgi:hypothetical protein
MLNGHFRCSTPNIQESSKVPRKSIRMSSAVSKNRESIKEEINNSKLIMMDINPQAAENLKNYRAVNKNLFNFREHFKNAKVSILKNAYTSYNNMRSEKGLTRNKISIHTKSIRRGENSDLKNQLLSIGVVENKKRSSEDLSACSKRSARGKFIASMFRNCKEYSTHFYSTSCFW